MHVPDGILPAVVCIAGYGVSGEIIWHSIKKINEKEEPRKEIPKASLGVAAFFVISLIHIPIPPTSVHLILTGLLGVLLGYYAFPAIFVSLLFQAILFQHGGLTTLGVNSFILGIPALLSYIFTKKNTLFKSRNKGVILFSGFIIGALSVGLSVLLFFLIVYFSMPATIDANAEKIALYGILIANVPLMIIEGIVTAIVLAYLTGVKPEILEV